VSRGGDQLREVLGQVVDVLAQPDRLTRLHRLLDVVAVERRRHERRDRLSSRASELGGELVELVVQGLGAPL
jgi:hypothetical protein